MIDQAISSRFDVLVKHYGIEITHSGSIFVYANFLGSGKLGLSLMN